MISVEEARSALLSICAPLSTERLPIARCADRVLREPITAKRPQPPFNASAMDGYAMRRADLQQDAELSLIGEAAAGHAFTGTVRPGQAVRIFTGAPVPNGADMVLIQERVTPTEGGMQIDDADQPDDCIRLEGTDFDTGFTLPAGTRLGARALALAAALGQSPLTVTRKPVVAIIATGDELVWPGEQPGDDQIFASNTFGLAAQMQSLGAEARLLPIAEDSLPALVQAFTLAQEADLIITVGGVSVGDHDLVQTAAETLGFERKFYKVAMRPGKPLMAGKVNGTPIIGLPGNPVSALICGKIFVAPVVEHMLGLPKSKLAYRTAPLENDLPENGPRTHFMRAQLTDDRVRVFPSQDSSLLSILNSADVLAMRPPHDPPRQRGELIRYLYL